MTAKRPTSPDAIVSVSLRATIDGGRKSPIPRMVYVCPVFFGIQRKEANDCAFFLNEIDAQLQPGGPSVVVPVMFLARDLVAPNLRPGVRFTLWEGRDIGEAEVLEIVRDT